MDGMVKTEESEARPKRKEEVQPPVTWLSAAGESLGPPLAIYLIAIILAATLAPFDFQWPPRFRAAFSFPISNDTIRDLLANFLLFIPVGFTFRLGIGSKWSMGRVLFHSAALSIVIELLQTMLRTRVSSGTDVVMNLLGAAAGSLIFGGLSAYLAGKKVGSVALELPLAGVFYLLIPILWLNALLIPSYPERVWLNIPLGVLGGLVLGSIGHHRLNAPGALSPAGIVGIIAVWMSLATLPSFLNKEPMLATSAVVVVFLTLGLVVVLLAMPEISFGTGRRFEAATLRRAIPIFLIYLVVDAFFPIMPLDSVWRWRWGFDHLQSEYPIVPLPAVFQIIEHAACSVLLGFMIAGLRGRVRESRESMLFWAGTIGLLFTLPIEILRGYHPDHHSSVAHGLLGLGAILLGAYLYRMHLRTVWSVLHRLPDG